MRIEDYGLIGDCETAALVGRDGSIDWLCWPRFDSGACFAALLGTADNGRWRIAPAQPARVTRAYRGQSLILETCFDTETGTVRLIDFMPPRTDSSELVRLVVGERGTVDLHMEWIVRFGYGAAVPWVSRTEDGRLQAIAGPDRVVLHAPVPTRGEDLRTVAEFRVSAGETLSFVMAYGASHQPVPPPIDAQRALAHCAGFWRDWSARFTGGGEWSEAVQRSLITLKALTYAPTGGIVAAPTTSLPERIGGPRNWDYRYCWLRDATLTLLALMNAGYRDEAQAWRNWLLRAVAGSPDQLQFLYGISGERCLDERELPWLPGYENSAPVRVGNGAFRQLQIDVYGELLDVLYHARCAGLHDGDWSWHLPRQLVLHLETRWDQPDEGIWEVRAPRQHHVYSKVMAWVAVDRAIKSIETFGLEGPLERWRALRRRIHDEVCARGVDPRRRCFVRAYGSDDLDASLLLLPQLGFLPAEDPRVQATIAATERELLRDGLVLRYDPGLAHDGLPGEEGAFIACSFWLADAYVLCGRRDEARELFEHLLSLRNDLGLMSEEYDVRARRMVGNFPQAFSHVALVNTALNLSERDAPARQHAGPRARS